MAARIVLTESRPFCFPGSSLSDGGRSAQFEETILITEAGSEILTKHTRPLPQHTKQA
jgi:hypothetical protein